MSVPEFPKPNPDFTQEQALTMILSSIALEEVAFSHIINAEGEKIQYILNNSFDGRPADLKDIVAVNKSVTDLLEIILQNQMILKNKMDRVLDYLPKPPCPPETPCTPEVPCPPEAPYPPKPPCPPEPTCTAIGCDLCNHPVCFGIIPKNYCYNEPLLLNEINACGGNSFASGNCSKILMPRTGTFAADLYLNTGNSKCSNCEVKLVVGHDGKELIMKNMSLSNCGCETLFHARTVFQIPCSCCPCYVSILVCTPCGMRIWQGQIIFTKL